MWIGANDLATQNRWVWSSNGYRIYPYVNWKGGIPKEGAGRCVGIDAVTFEWINTSCEKKAAFFCEKGIIQMNYYSMNTNEFFLLQFFKIRSDCGEN